MQRREGGADECGADERDADARGAGERDADERGADERGAGERDADERDGQAPCHRSDNVSVKRARAGSVTQAEHSCAWRVLSARHTHL